MDSEPTKFVHLNLPISIVARIDAEVAKRCDAAGAKISRTDVVRQIIVAGLDAKPAKGKR